MYPSAIVLLLCIRITVLSASTPHYDNRVYDSVIRKRQSSGNSTQGNLVVDLGYGQYEGVANRTTGLNTWLGNAPFFQL